MDVRGCSLDEKGVRTENFQCTRSKVAVLIDASFPPVRFQGTALSYVVGLL